MLLASHRVSVCFLSLLILVLCSTPVHASTVTGEGSHAGALAQAGRPIERSDWIDYLPVAIIAVVVVVAVDAFFIARVLRDRRK
jgi:hypothetical protein